MTRSQLHKVSRLVTLCATLWASSYSAVAADASGTLAGSKEAPMGGGSAYLFGFMAGLIIFVSSIAIRLRKEHLQRNGK